MYPSGLYLPFPKTYCMSKVYRFSFLLTGLLLLTVMQAQRPKVGLVLSGGGAKGMAHIGVIQILDSLEIPVDLVTGTSMGSIVGGLYSIGYTGDQIQREVLDVNWNDLMRDQPLREDRTLDDKFIQDVTLLSLDLNGVKVSLPSGLRRGQKIYNKFVSLRIRTSTISPGLLPVWQQISRIANKWSFARDPYPGRSAPVWPFRPSSIPFRMMICYWWMVGSPTISPPISPETWERR